MKTLFTFFVFIFLLTTAKAQEIDVTLSATGGFSVIDFGGTPTLFRILGNGKVGIGTTSPQNLLDIEGSMVIGAGYSGTFTAPANGLLVQGNVGIGALSPKNKLDIEGGMVIGVVYAGTNTAPTNGLLVQGNVGIGTTNPTSKLQVEGNVDINSDLDVDGGTLHVDGTLNRVGIGTGTNLPLSLLDIRGTDAIMELSGHPTDKEGLAFQIDYENVNTSSRIFFRENNTQLHGTSFIHAGLPNPVFDGTEFTLPINAFHIVTHNESAAGTVVMTFLKSNAFVGIGTTDPKSKLHVTGLPEYANNAAAITGGLTAGAFYRTGDLLKVVH